MKRQDARRAVWIATLVVCVVSMRAPTASADLGVKKSCYLVRMADGTGLATDVYTPRFPLGRRPALLIRTTDGRDTVSKLQARYVCRRGYALVVQDMRGNIRSHGAEMAFEHDGWAGRRDGHEAIRWVARQSWCNGRVGTWGPSVMGFAQNLLASDAPAALRAQHVMMAFSDMYSQAAYQGGAYRQELVDGWVDRFAAGDRYRATVLSHPRYDAFWAEMNCDTQASKVNTPAVFWGGWHDAFLQGTLHSFTTIHNQGGPRARGRCKLIVGPWSHWDIESLVDPRTARSQYRPAVADPLRFFDYWLQCERNGAARDRAVHYYVMGDPCDRSRPGNRWRTADNWPPESVPRRMYLHDGQRLLDSPRGQETGDGSLDALTYQYDPNHPVPTIGGLNLNLPAGPKDQRAVESRDDVLLFTSDPLSAPLEVTGQITAELFVSSDCPDTDFTVKLTDVYPDGRSILVADGIFRARYRESFEHDAFLQVGEVYQITVDLWSTSIAFSRGHRIRVAVSSSNSPRFAPNPNTGGPLPGDGETRVATNTLHVSAARPSCVILPVCEIR